MTEALRENLLKSRSSIAPWRARPDQETSSTGKQAERERESVCVCMYNIYPYMHTYIHACMDEGVDGCMDGWMGVYEKTHRTVCLYASICPTICLSTHQSIYVPIYTKLERCTTPVCHLCMRWSHSTCVTLWP